jgi:hypothetical protein
VLQLIVPGLIALMPMALGGCASGTLLHADFDADTVGATPNTALPGSPTGDLIYLADPSNPSDQLIVVNSAALSSRSVKYSNVNVPVTSRFVGFMAKEEALGSTQKFRAIWAGRVDLAPAGSHLDLWLGDSHFKAIAALRLDNGQVLLRTSNSPEQYENIGAYSESENHSVIITVNKATQQYSVVMAPNSVLSGWRSVLSTDALGTDRPTVYFHFSEPASSSGNYVADGIAIEKVK